MTSLIIYWGSCLLSILIAKMESIFKNRSGIGIIVASSIPLIIITSIRYRVGTDYLSYRNVFHDIEQGYQGRYEWLYFYINRIIAFLGGGDQWFFFVSAVIFFLCVYKRIFADSPNRAMSIFLLLGSMSYFAYCNIMRQMTGAAICYYALGYVQERRFFLFLLTVFIASGFHTSCWLFIIVYLFNYKKILKFIIPAFMVISFLLGDEIINLVRYVASKSFYIVYLQKDINTIGMLVFVTIAVGIFSLICFNEKNEKYHLYFGCQLIMTCFMALSWNIPLIGRCGELFLLPQIVLLPMCLQTIKSKYVRIVFTVIISGLFFVYSSYSIVVNGSHDVIPYQTFFDED